MKYYYVDYENVGPNGLNGIDQLGADCHVFLYWHKHKGSSPPKGHEVSAKITHICIDDSSKDAVDNAISEEIRKQIQVNKASECFIVSNDKGFDKLPNNIKRIASIEASLRMPKSKPILTTAPNKSTQKQKQTPTKSKPTPKQTQTPVKNKSTPKQNQTPVKNKPTPKQTQTPVKNKSMPKQTQTPVKNKSISKQNQTPTKNKPTPKQTQTPAQNKSMPKQNQTPTKNKSTQKQTQTPVKNKSTPKQNQTSTKNKSTPIKNLRK